MSCLRRKLYKNKLTDILARADDEFFFRMVWAAHAIQSERAERAAYRNISQGSSNR